MVIFLFLSCKCTPLVLIFLSCALGSCCHWPSKLLFTFTSLWSVALFIQRISNCRPHWIDGAPFSNCCSYPLEYIKRSSNRPDLNSCHDVIGELVSPSWGYHQVHEISHFGMTVRYSCVQLPCQLHPVGSPVTQRMSGNRWADV